MPIGNRGRHLPRFVIPHRINFNDFRSPASRAIGVIGTSPETEASFNGL
jgi:hypothetical protein